MDDGDLKAAQVAFERGDYAEARRRARAILGAAKGSEADPLRQKAQELLQRTRNDRAAVILGVLCFLFFVAMFLSYAGKR